MVVKVRRPKAIVFDILGTASKSGFLEQILFPYLKQNLDAYISKNWPKRDFISLYAKIVDQSQDLNRQDSKAPLVQNHESTGARGSLSAFINYVTENGVNCSAITKLRFKVWFEGYNSMKIKTPIYRDVPNRMRAWNAEGLKFYVFSNTWVEAQKALLKNTNHGDLTTLIMGHFDNDFGLLTEAESWTRFCQQIAVEPADVLFLTKAPLEGKAAMDAGINVVLVLTHRHNVRALSADDKARFPYVRTLDDLLWADDASQVASSAQQAESTPQNYRASSSQPRSSNASSAQPQPSLHSQNSASRASSRQSSQQ